METGPLIPDTFALAAHCHAEGNRALAAGNWRAGLAHYEQALRLRPDFVEAYNDLGMALQHFGEWARAAQCYRQAIHLMPSFAPAYNNMGNASGHRANGQRRRQLSKRRCGCSRTVRKSPSTWQAPITTRVN